MMIMINHGDNVDDYDDDDDNSRKPGDKRDLAIVDEG